MEITSSKIASSYFRTRIQNWQVEEFWIIALNSLCEIIESEMLFRGTVDACLVHPRDIFRFAVTWNAVSIIVGHNHPSGACYPSREDIAISKDLRKAGALLKIPLLDHVIFTHREHYSFADSFWRKKIFLKGGENGPQQLGFRLDV